LERLSGKFPTRLFPEKRSPVSMPLKLSPVTCPAEQLTPYQEQGSFVCFQFVFTVHEEPDVLSKRSTSAWHSAVGISDTPSQFIKGGTEGVSVITAVAVAVNSTVEVGVGD